MRDEQQDSAPELGWVGLMPPDKWLALSENLSPDLLRELLNALEECGPRQRAKLIDAVLQAKPFGERAVLIALGRSYDGGSDTVGG